MTEATLILYERVVFLHYMYIASLVVSEEKKISLFAPADVHKMSCNVQQLSFQRAIANVSYYLPSKMVSSGY